MIGLLQRVTEARVQVEGVTIGAIATGLLVFVGVERGDGKSQADRLLERLSSSWAAFVVHACSFLRRGGRLALVLPEEILHTSYADAVRRYLRGAFHTTAVIRFDDFVFPDSQERVILLCASGKDQAPRGRLVLTSVPSPASLADLDGHIASGESFSSTEQPQKWQPASRDQGTEVLDRLAAEGLFVPLREIGKASIGYVSGANDYFVLRPGEARRYGFPDDVLVPTLIAARQVQGARISQQEFDQLLTRDERCLLWNGSGATVPAVARYIRHGESQGIERRYKCRVRQPWYVVPGVGRPDAVLTYMANDFPRLALNEAQVTCSNNLLAVQLSGVAASLRLPFVAAFYNSATMLSAERTGRSYGGGVLKLEPSEADRLLVPAPTVVARGKHTLSSLFAQIDGKLRKRNALELFSVVDDLVLRRLCSLREDDVRAIQRTRVMRRLSRKPRRVNGLSAGMPAGKSPGRTGSRGENAEPEGCRKRGLRTAPRDIRSMPVSGLVPLARGRRCLSRSDVALRSKPCGWYRGPGGQPERQGRLLHRSSLCPTGALLRKGA
ncbi:MAG: D-aminoacyl-tRNA deacylase [Gammaproteobacteria bacterium]